MCMNYNKKSIYSIFIYFSFLFCYFFITFMILYRKCKDIIQNIYLKDIDE
jgi:hypothetical protein